MTLRFCFVLCMLLNNHEWLPSDAQIKCLSLSDLQELAGKDEPENLTLGLYVVSDATL